MPRNIKIEKHCMLVKYTGTDEVVRIDIIGKDFRINDRYSGINELNTYDK